MKTQESIRICKTGPIKQTNDKKNREQQNTISETNNTNTVKELVFVQFQLSWISLFTKTTK
jgi:hypothetical protein